MATRPEGAAVEQYYLVIDSVERVVLLWVSDPATRLPPGTELAVINFRPDITIRADVKAWVLSADARSLSPAPADVIDRLGLDPAREEQKQAARFEAVKAAARVCAGSPLVPRPLQEFVAAYLAFIEG